MRDFVFAACCIVLWEVCKRAPITGALGAIGVLVALQLIGFPL
jgi:hypothetical protein